MSKVAIQGNASGTGTFTIAAPNSNTDRTLTLPDEAGTVLTSASNITNMAGPAFRAYMSSNLSLTTNVTTVIPANTETYDTDGCYDTSTYRFTPTVAGYYYANVNGRYHVPTSNQCAFALSVRVNGSIVASGQHDMYAGNNTDGLTFNRSTIVYLNGTTDYIDFTAYQYIYTSPQSRDLVSASSQTFIEAFFIRK